MPQFTIIVFKPDANYTTPELFVAQCPQYVVACPVSASALTELTKVSVGSYNLSTVTFRIVKNPDNLPIDVSISTGIIHTTARPSEIDYK